jgi:D-alanyl-D-alanine dipeptidase
MRNNYPLWLVLGAALVFGSSGCRAPGLADVEKVVPGVVLDIRYATTNNFTGQRLYPAVKCVLRKNTVEKLRAAQSDAAELGLGLKIFDGYRPLSVQKKMWAIFPNEDYVANPKKGSRHNRGAAVDLTLIRLSDGAELLMPTGYDDFTPRAHRDYMHLDAEPIRNRELLERVMTKHGFVGLSTEWWHFDDADWKRYGILDVDYSKVR